MPARHSTNTDDAALHRENTVKTRVANAQSVDGRVNAGSGKQPAEIVRGDELQNLLGAVIMIVDDEALAIEVTRLHLEDAGFTHFVSVTDATKALERVAESRPDILLLDLMMPGLSGFEILELMESHHILKDVPTIILTASTEPQTKLRALRLGATEFLTKPVDPSELVLRVRNTLAAKAYWQGLGSRGRP
jgi:CheY-like chemotaxis protein